MGVVKMIQVADGIQLTSSRSLHGKFFFSNSIALNHAVAILQ